MFCCDFDIGFISSRFFFRGSCLDWDCCVLVQLAASIWFCSLRFACGRLCGWEPWYFLGGGLWVHSPYDFWPVPFWSRLVHPSYSCLLLWSSDGKRIYGRYQRLWDNYPFYHGASAEWFFEAPNVLYVPALRRNLLSISSFRQTHKISFQRTEVLFTPFGSRCVARAVFKDGLYFLLQSTPVTPVAALADAPPTDNLLMQWHRRLNHIGFRSLQKLAK